MRETLANCLKMSCMNTVGAAEHMQIADLIRRSKIHVVDAGVAAAARDAMTNHLLSMEANLDLVPLPDRPTWFEWPLPPRNGRAHAGTGNERTGCLITPHPADANLHMIVSCWELDDGPMHAYGIAIIAQRDLDALAENARYAPNSTYEESMGRIMSMIATFVPPAFDEEMKILSDGEDQAMAAMRDATAEIPMLLSLLMLCRAQGGAILGDREDDAVSIKMGEAYAQGLMARLFSTMFRHPTEGFSRLGRETMAWLRPLKIGALPPPQSIPVESNP